MNEISNQSQPKKWLSVPDVAEKIGLTDERVRQLIRMKKIKATKIGGWLVDPEDLETFIHHRTNVKDVGQG